ncbi:unnamed protein product [Microthlaspi erraticum]|uniref:Arabidopsis retrotransposon Orf1 C-terminal domain-containing protein n=1 Tax=Microthlaspi erraticum TaxID=1685480 RepID=A0A6D2KIV5_9BRAS|nr:unnamed protein product [Microthlaspi erraticum]
MKALGIFEDVELVLKNMHLAKLFSTTWNPTRSSLASSSFNEGEKRMVTFRQLEILFGFNYGEGTKWNFKEKELQRVWATIADGVYSSSRSRQLRSGAQS